MTELTEKGQRRRAEILAATRGLLAERGYRATSLRAIGRALGVEPAHLLHYFASKEALLEAVIADWDAESAAAVDAASGSFLAEWPDIVARNASAPGLVHLYTALAAEAASDDHPSRAFFRDRFSRVHAAIVADLERQRARGDLAADLDLDRTATRLISFADGVQLHWLVDPSLDMADELRHAIAALIGGGPR